jgi:hypothetical protein
MAKHDHQDWEAAWEAAYPADEPRPAAEPQKRRRRSPRTRSVVLATGMLLLGVTGVGVAANGDVLREGQRNGTATRETEIISRTNETGQPKGGYSTRQSNLSNSGGGAIYGCRAAAEVNNNNTNPCLRANNLSTGLAFEFNATNGNLGGTIDVGNGGDDEKPFTTNATGVATGLNADEVDGQSAEEIVAAGRAGQDTRWALIDEAGQIEQQTGGFTAVNCYQANDNCYIDAGEDVRDNGLHAQIAVANTDGSPRLSGETGTAPCGAAFVNCAPPNTERNEVLVVAPRDDEADPAGGPTTESQNRFRFYVYVTGSQSG